MICRRCINLHRKLSYSHLIRLKLFKCINLKDFAPSALNSSQDLPFKQDNPKPRKILSIELLLLIELSKRHQSVQGRRSILILLELLLLKLQPNIFPHLL